MYAIEMRRLRDCSQNTNKELQIFYDKAMNEIRNAAMEGDSELCFYKVCHICDKGYTPKIEKMLIEKLNRNGFKIKKGYQLGKGMGSWETPFITW